MKRFIRLKRVVLVLLRARVSRRPASQTQYDLFESFLELGGVYIKFVQILLIRMNEDRSNLSREYTFLLKKTYDQAPFEYIDITKVLHAELGQNARHIQSVTPHPVAAGSFGQLYQGRLASGETVAIKVLRPSVVATINFDLAILKFVVRLIPRSKRSAIDLKDMFAKFEETTLGELNYQVEASYASELYERYIQNAKLVIPKTFAALSSRHIITQEFITGLPLTDVVSAKDAGIDPSQYVQQHIGSSLQAQMITAGQAMLESFLIHGSGHGDPHPGNIMLLPDNKIAFLDFGIAALAPKDKQAFFAVVKEYEKIYSGNFNVRTYTYALFDLAVQDLANAIRSLDVYTNNDLKDRIWQAIAGSTEQTYQASTFDVDQLLYNQKFLKIFNTIINEDNRFGLNIKIEEPAFFRATLMYISLVQSLGIKQEVLQSVYTNVVTLYENHDFEPAPRFINPLQAVTVIAEWLDRMASNDIYLYQQMTRKINLKELHV